MWAFRGDSNMKKTDVLGSILVLEREEIEIGYRNVPGNLRPSFGFSGEFWHVLQVLCLSWRPRLVQPVKGALLFSPLSFPVFLSEVFLLGERHLHSHSVPHFMIRNAILHTNKKNWVCLYERVLVKNPSNFWERGRCKTEVDVPWAPSWGSKLCCWEYNEQRTWWYRGGSRWWWSIAKWHQPIPTRYPWCERSPSWRTLLWMSRPGKENQFYQSRWNWWAEGSNKNRWKRVLSQSMILTNCAIQKAAKSRRPGRSVNDQLLDLVTKIKAWLMILTCRYTAAVSSLGLPRSDLTPNVRCAGECHISLHSSKKFKILCGNRRGLLCTEHKSLQAYLEEVSSISCPKEDDSHHGQVSANDNSLREDLRKFPAIGERGWLDAILGNSHDGTWESKHNSADGECNLEGRWRFYGRLTKNTPIRMNEEFVDSKYRPNYFIHMQKCWRLSSRDGNDNLPSFRMAMIKTMNGEKSNFQISVSRRNPSCRNGLESYQQLGTSFNCHPCVPIQTTRKRWIIRVSDYVPQYELW